ncbi:virB8 family protein [Allosphingosinicella deserti]|uniref:Bacterial virulence protein VirB8 domain-containing protein n=1 Tax=Allosphingosinicella deserti TaxID=2116704 RepID=A0A2P7QEK2_9SPHN|nr:type IV secretion system protein [Sphingomonas deserti]PSJ36403.1 hypothetical protein C7I55_26560 [Sphingomonas deserti]
MSGQPDDKREAYYQRADAWARDIEHQRRRLIRNAWLIAAAATVIAIAEAIALIVLAPLKTVVPYTILVDRHTGFVQSVDPLGTKRITGDAALTESFLAQYVTARESFDLDTVQADYRKVGLWSADRARSDYVAAMQGNNPDSPLQRYGRNASIEARVKSVSSLGPHLAMVRFDTVQRDAGGRARFTGAWSAIIRHRYTSATMPVADRFINPLGFQVLRYRRTAEALPPAETLPIAPPPAADPRGSQPLTVPAPPAIAPPPSGTAGEDRSGPEL